MVLCWIALPILALLGIFSVKYRRLAAESLECLFKTATFRRCNSRLDDRIKSQISGHLLKFSPRSAKFFYTNYKIISLILLIIFLWSTYASAAAIYNYIQHGNCNDPDSDDFCILDINKEEEQIVSCENQKPVQQIPDEGFSDLYQPCPCAT